MTATFTRRALLGTAATAAIWGIATPAFAENIVLRLSSPASPTDQRAIALTEVFAPAVKDFATLQPHWGATLFKQGTELEAIARGNLEMSIASAQELMRHERVNLLVVTGGPGVVREAMKSGKRVPVVNIVDMPEELWDRTIDKDIGNPIEPLLKEPELKGYLFPDPLDARHSDPGNCDPGIHRLLPDYL